MDLNKKIFLRVGLYFGVLFTIFFLVYQLLYPSLTNLWIFLIFLGVGAALVVALYVEYRAYFSRYDIRKQSVDRDYLLKALDQANQYIKEKDEQISLMSNFSGQGVILINEQKYIIYTNDVAIKLLDIQQTNQPTFHNSIRNTPIKEQINKTIETGKMITESHMIDHKNLNIKSMQTVSGHTKLVLVQIEDLTDQVQLQNVKKDFFSYAGHELKTPITVLRGYAELINQDIITGNEAKEVSKKMIDLTDYMKGFVDDMLMLSRLETFVDNDKVSVNLKEALLNTIEYFDQALKEKQIKVEYDIEDILFEADPLDMQKLFKNMIENAIKYNNHKGKIQISLKYALNQIVFTIKDFGQGIPYKDQERIFERFYRVNQTRKEPGTGLGLAIVKHIVNKYHGHISVESKVDEFTKFTIVI